MKKIICMMVVIMTLIGNCYDVSASVIYEKDDNSVILEEKSGFWFDLISIEKKQARGLCVGTQAFF